ncbi:dihydroneopterin aldolase/2-amino-4-hydroxy-6-hydroxymethyldihydropteridine diphosphokinase [Brevibacterium paucivorans]|uniref:Bifunctional folate synthesis protein n=1 Tax=Brevibacterium paucivorans TaxID=170994 RepID=A0ABS2SMD7_9MICO|nr:2-amino-4-hydroxy-6-hydroxymethyldihydropteridine diphosphokinase [Brevibacterium paucivorans]MBM7816749.1 dihydroneopterin aldolase/2-amino-4-hydroxy-6-hydroxymethyldihydropteridine diphosphokinase [Brevibacterium paucivorans]
MTDDRITLTGLKARGYHGVFDFEKREGQDFVVDVVLHTDHTQAGESDRLEDTINYADVAQIVADRITGEPFDLIEALAWAIAGDLLRVAGSVEVTVHKPQAPIDQDFQDVSVTVRRSGAEWQGERQGQQRERLVRGGQAVIGVGANMGKPAETVQSAMDALDLHPHITVLQRSSLYRSAPVGGVEQDDFINAVTTVETTLSAYELLGVCQGVELAHGRTRDVRWGPRTLDLDLIRFTPHEGLGRGAGLGDAGAQLTLNDPVLTLPHPEACNRAFVLTPWHEIDPSATIEVDGTTLTLRERLEELGDQGVERA